MQKHTLLVENTRTEGMAPLQPTGLIEQSTVHCDSERSR